MSIEARLQSVMDQVGSDPHLMGIVASVERPALGLRWVGSHGNCDVASQFFAALMLRLVQAAAKA